MGEDVEVIESEKGRIVLPPEVPPGAVFKAPPQLPPEGFYAGAVAKAPPQLPPAPPDPPGGGPSGARVKAPPPEPPAERAKDILEAAVAVEPVDVVKPKLATGRKPTLRDVVSGQFAQYAKRWTVTSDAKPEFKADVVESIYATLKLGDFDPNQVMALEFNSYLERYLWPFFKAETASKAHVLSISLLLNEKVREGSIAAWDSIATRRENFASYFERMLDLWKSDSLGLREKTYVLQFLINCFQSLEQDFVRECCLRLTGLQSWFHLNDLHRENLLNLNKKLPPFWKKVQKKFAEPKTNFARHERNFMSELLDEFLATLEEFGSKDSLGAQELCYVERFIELMIDLLDQLPTRRFFRPLMVDKHFVVRCRGSKVAQLPEARLMNQLLGILRYYENFEIDDNTGVPLTRRDITDLHYERLQLLQRVCFQEFPDNAGLRQLTMLNVSALDTRDALLQHFGSLPLEVLKVLCAKVCYLDVSKDSTLASMEEAARVALEAAEKLEADKEQAAPDGARPKKKRKKKVKTEEEQRLRELLIEILISRLERPVLQQDDIEKMPLYPTEELIWDPHLVPEEHYAGDFSLALPKLNLQFLTIHDYLLRNFNLFRLESTYEIREDLQDQVPRMKPQHNAEGNTQFAGRARMALPLQGLQLLHVRRPKVGEQVPAEVRAEVRFCLTGVLPHVRMEWDQLREHDVIFLIRIEAPEEPYEGKVTELTVSEFPEKFGVKALRGAEVLELLDEEGNVVSDPNPAERKTPVGDNRVARVLLDPAQYHADLESVAAGKAEVYSTLNLVVRRKPKENNFKAILQTIRSLMNSEDTVVPDWLHDLFLGYGDPGAAQYWKLRTMLDTIDFRDTFLDQDHILESFPDAEDIDVPEDLQRPFRLKFERSGQAEPGHRPPERVVASAYTLPNMGPYEECKPRENKIRFTPVQVEAIRSGVNPGLTMVVGPPGTGKTDTAVQVVNLLFHNFPDQKIVLVAHSNQALNDLFEKIVALDIPERYLLRLGRGIEELDAIKDFSKWGRVNHMLQRRLELLAKVERLADSFGVQGVDAAYTCENAQHFFLHHVQYRWEEFQKKLAIAGKDGSGLHKVMLRKQASAKRQRREMGEAAEPIEAAVPAETAAPASEAVESAEADERAEAAALKESIGPSQEAEPQEAADPMEELAKLAAAEMSKAAPEDEAASEATEGAKATKPAEAAESPKQAEPTEVASQPAEAAEPAKEGAEPSREAVEEPSEEAQPAETEEATAAEPADAEITEAAAKAAAVEAAASSRKRIQEAAEAEEAKELSRALEQLSSGQRTVVALLFPFHEFFSDAPGPLFPAQSFDSDLNVAEGCYRYFENMFREIEECHAFELLRNSHDRGNYLITTHARIIAMTCTHAALTRSTLVGLNFKYDNLIMEESAQILEVETFIPMLLQTSDRGVSRLKRVMLIGDHHQLPPVVKNRAFQKYGHLDQSLYARFVRLKTPTVDLNLQGRARPQIADLYSWRYRDLRNLSNVLTDTRYRLANVGLSFEYQFIDVEDFDGKGESQPTPFFYQNLGEAEYCVALFMYMRLLGYPASRISILSTYNGQKALLRDVVRQRCAWNPLFGEPNKITTVDRFQGQQNDFIIVSLVRTNHVGHLRDVRRLIVTMSRARFGLYVFGRFSLFENCFELTPVFSRFAKRPRQLSLELEERPDSQRKAGEVGRPTLSRDLHHMWALVQERMRSQFQEAARTVAGGGGAVAAGPAASPGL